MDRLGARASEFFVVRIGREPQRVTNQVHDVRLSALFRVIGKVGRQRPRSSIMFALNSSGGGVNSIGSWWALSTG